MKLLLGAAATVALLLTTAGGSAQAQFGSSAECDRLAANPDDPGRVGSGVPFDKIDGLAAVSACRSAAQTDSGQPRLLYQLGRALDFQKDFGGAVSAYEEAAAGGYSPALNALGSLYEGGFGLPKDEAKAAMLYRQAAEAGYVIASGNLGLLFLEGRGVPKDQARAAELFRPLAESGDAWGQVNLGLLYEQGQGVVKDEKAATDWYRKAADQGDGFGLNNLGAMHARGGGVAQDHPEAVRLFRLSAAQGNHFAERNLGHAYEHGQGVRSDPVEATRWYRLAGQGGDLDALNALAWMWARAGENLQEAEALARRAVAATPNPSEFRGNYLDTLGWVRYRQGRFEEALQDLERAIAAKPLEAPFHEHLGDVYAALGSKVEAQAAWKKALDLPPPSDSQAAGWDRPALERKVARAD